MSKVDKNDFFNKSINEISKYVATSIIILYFFSDMFISLTNINYRSWLFLDFATVIMSFSLFLFIVNIRPKKNEIGDFSIFFIVSISSFFLMLSLYKTMLLFILFLFFLFVAIRFYFFKYWFVLWSFSMTMPFYLLLEAKIVFIIFSLLSVVVMFLSPYKYVVFFSSLLMFICGFLLYYFDVNYNYSFSYWFFVFLPALFSLYIANEVKNEI